MVNGKDLPYFALDEPLADEYVLTLLGRAIPIANLKRPLGTRIRPELTSSKPPDQVPGENAPDAESKTDKQVSPSVTLDNRIHERPDWQKDLYPQKAVVCNDIRILQQKAVTAKAKLSIDNFLKTYATFTKSNALDFSSKRFRRITIAFPQDKIQTLLKNVKDLYADPVLGLLKERGELALIVSILTCSEMSKQNESDKSMGGGGGAEIPGGPEVALEGEFRLTTHEEVRGTYEGEVIVACSYHRLTWKKIEQGEENIWGRIKKMFWSYWQEASDEVFRVPFVSPSSLEPWEVGVYLSNDQIQGNIGSLFGTTSGGGAQGDDPAKMEATDDLSFNVF